MPRNTATAKTATVKRAFLLSFAQRYSSMLIQFISMVVVSRLLLPEEIGLFAEGMALVVLVSLPVEQGIHDYLVQETNLNDNCLQTAMGLGLLSGIVGALIMFSWSLSPASWLNHSEQTVGVLRVLALGVLLQPLTMPAEAILNRQMRFDLLYVIFTSRTFIGALAVILLATFTKIGAVALAWGIVTERIVTLISLFIYQQYGNREFLIWHTPNLKDWQKVFTFSKYWTGIHILRQACDALLMLSIARILGTSALGYLNRSQVLVSLYERAIMQGITPVLLPYLSQQNRHKNDLTKVYLKKLSLLSVTAWPFFGFVALMTKPIVLVLLGENWQPIVPLVRVLCISGMALPFNGAILSFVVAMGQTRAYFPVQFMIQGAKFAAGALGSLLGIGGIGLAYVCSNVLKSILPYKLLKERINTTKTEIWQQLLPSLAVTLASLCIPTIVLWGNVTAGLLPQANQQVNIIVLLILASFGAIFGWVVSILLVRHPIKNLRPGTSPVN